MSEMVKKQKVKSPAAQQPSATIPASGSKPQATTTPIAEKLLENTKNEAIRELIKENVRW